MRDDDDDDDVFFTWQINSAAAAATWRSNYLQRFTFAVRGLTSGNNEK